MKKCVSCMKKISKSSSSLNQINTYCLVKALKLYTDNVKKKVDNISILWYLYHAYFAQKKFTTKVSNMCLITY